MINTMYTKKVNDHESEGVVYRELERSESSHIEAPYEAETLLVAAEGFRDLKSRLWGYRLSIKLIPFNPTHKYTPSSGHV